MRSSKRNDRSPLLGLTEDDIRLLQMRAARYAARVEELEGDITDAVVFVRGGTRYAAPLTGLREARPLRGPCHIPGASPVVPGIVCFRGEILSLHDLATFMDPSAGPRPAGWLIVAEHKGERIGLLADEILGIEQFARARVRPTPVTFGERAACFDGVLDTGVLLLSPPRLFENPAFFSAF